MCVKKSLWLGLFSLVVPAQFDAWAAERPAPFGKRGEIAESDFESEASNAVARAGCTVDVLEFRLGVGSDCVKPGELVIVELHQRGLDQVVRGFQAFAQFDNAALTFGTGTYTTSPFGLAVINPITAVGNNIDMAAGINDLAGQLPTSADAKLATLTFTAGVTQGPTVVSFRVHDPPTRFSDSVGDEVLPCLVDSPTIVVDGTNPMITCPGPVTIECTVSPIPASTGGLATAFDNLDPVPAITFTDSVAGLAGCPQGHVITRTWKATDCAGNFSTCAQTITVDDRTAPVITCPSNVTVGCGASTAPSNTGSASATDNCDTTPTIARSDVVTAGSCPQGGSIARTWTATDDCGNVSSCVQTITVVDTTPPIITCPPPATIECSASTAPSNTGSASATDGCDPLSIVTFTDNTIGLTACNSTGRIIRTWKATDACGNFSTCSQTIDLVDTTNPVVLCPSNITTQADAGNCGSATVTYTTPTATDNCDPTPLVSCFPASGTVFPTGPTSVICTATDHCGKSSFCTFHVNVQPVNRMVVNVGLSPNTTSDALTRCIAFDLWQCPGSTPATTVSKVMTFTNGTTGQVVVEVPCGDYDCVTARDRQHTLRRTDEGFGISGTNYVADFTGNPSSGGDWLIGGNLNDDTWIDMLDFGMFSSKYFTAPGLITSCPGSPALHADINGDNWVDNLDFTFIQANFLKGNEANCCGAAGSVASGLDMDFPVERISIRELNRLGLSDLAAGDLNGDGWLDVLDIEAFAAGVRPDPGQMPSTFEVPKKTTERELSPR